MSAKWPARLLDGGVTEDGRAYLVMEWVPGDGERLDELARTEPGKARVYRCIASATSRTAT